MNEIIIPENQPEVVDPSDAQAAVESFIPYFSMDTRKTKYLSYRASGFTVKEASQLANISPGGKSELAVLKQWRRRDPVFRYWDGPGVIQLQRLAGAHFTYVEFSRNFRLVMEKDSQVLYKAVMGEELDELESEYLMKIRSQYNPKAMDDLSRALKADEESAGKKRNFLETIIDMNSGGQITQRIVTEG